MIFLKNFFFTPCSVVQVRATKDAQLPAGGRQALRQAGAPTHGGMFPPPLIDGGRVLALSQGPSAYEPYAGKGVVQEKTKPMQTREAAGMVEDVHPIPSQGPPRATREGGKQPP